jgi:hypothetical protein
MRKLAKLLSLTILVWSATAVSVFATGPFFIGIKGGSHFFPRAPFFFQPRGRVHFFLQFGHQPFVIPPWAPTPWGYYPQTTSIPYPVSPQQVLQQNFSGTDSSGVLYVDG